MRILFLIDGLQCGGKERQLVELACGLKRLGKVNADDLAVVTMVPAGHFDPVLEAAGITVLRVIRRYRFDPFILFRLKKIFSEFKPDIIHSFSLMTTLYSILTLKPKGTKIIDGSIRNAFPINGLKERIFRMISYLFSDMVMANSQAGLDAKRAPQKKWVVLQNGFDFKRIRNLRSKEDVKKDLGIVSGQVVGMVAGFSKNKDWDTFFEAAKIVIRHRSDVIFLAVGGGPTLVHYQNKYHQCPDIVFTGRLTDAENLIQLFDVGVLCSRIEGIPNSVMEYMALGKSVVVTDGGGICELVFDGQTGFVIPVSDPHSLSDRILELLDNPKIAIAMGMKGQTRIIEHFSIEKTIADACKIYSKICANQYHV